MALQCEAAAAKKELITKFSSTYRDRSTGCVTKTWKI